MILFFHIVLDIFLSLNSTRLNLYNNPPQIHALQ